jgi:S-adenosyl methyltransferase
MGQPDWAPKGIDLNTPSMARAYDCKLGGTHHFPADQEFRRAWEAAMPDPRRIGKETISNCDRHPPMFA